MADRTVKVTLTAVAQQYIAEFQKAEAQTKKTTSTVQESLQKQKDAMQNVGVAALAMGTVAAAGLAYIIKTTADFDAQMSQVQSLSHATADEMTNLRDAALTAGQGIGLSASQVADAETELVKAGVSVRDQLGGALVGTLNLAAAGQMNVADATQIAASAMTQFKLQGKDVPHIADLLAAGADKALGSVADLGQGLKFVGPVAQSMGVSIDQTVGTLALFAQNGILAEQAGTGLRGVLLSLTSPSKLASDVLQKYGVTLYDAQGKFVGINGAAQALKDGLGGLDQATRNQALGQIFGNAQITEATILMQGGAKAVDDMTASVNDQAFAAQQAAGKMDNLNGDMAKLGAAFETDIIKSGTGANDILRNLTQAATNLVSGIGSLPAPVLEAGVAVLALVAGVGILGGGFLVLIPRIQATRAAMAELNLSGKSTAVMFGKGGAVLLGLAAVASGIANLGSSSQLAADQMANVNNVMAKLSDKGLNDLFKNAGAILVDGTKKTDKFKESLNSIATGNFWENESGFTKMIDGLTFGLTHLSDVYKTNEAQFKQMGTTLAATAKSDFGTATNQFQTLVKAAGGGKEAIRQLLTVMPDYKAALIDLASQHGKTLTQQELFNLAMGKGALAAELSSTATDQSTEAIAKLAGKAADANGDVQKLADTLSGLGQGSRDVSGAQIQLQQAIADATKALQDNGATLDISTQKGRDNQTALNGIAQSALALAGAQEVAGASTDVLTATVQGGRDAFIASAVQMGLTQAAAADLANQYGLIPGNVATAVAVTGTEKASTDVQKFLDWVSKIPNQRTMTILVNSQNPNVGFGLGDGRAAGGAIYGPGGPREDRVPIMASNGEHMFTASDVNAMGGQGAVYQFRANLHRGFADGGAVTYAPMTFTPTATTVNVPAPQFTVLVQSKGGIDLTQYVDVKIQQNEQAQARRTRMG